MPRRSNRHDRHDAPLQRRAARARALKVWHTQNITHTNTPQALTCSPFPVAEMKLEQALIMLLAAREHVHLAELVPLAQRRRVSLGDGGCTARLGERLGGRRQWRRRRPGSGCDGHCGASQCHEVDVLGRL